MPRSRRATLGTGLWSEKSIRGLTRLQQQAYTFLWTQPDLNRCGVLAYRLRSWAQTSADGTEEDLHRDFIALHDSGHVVLDDVDEQILIRTYVRHDGLLTQPLVVAATARDYFKISSLTIRAAFLAELRRLFDDASLDPRERVGLQLLIGANPADLGMKNAANVAAAIDTGLIQPFVDAIADGAVQPFQPHHLPKGLTEGQREGLTKGLPRGSTEGQREGIGNHRGNPLTRSPVTVTVPVTSPVTVPVTAPSPPPPAPPDDDTDPVDDPTGALLREHAAAYASPPPPDALRSVKTAIMRLVADGTHPDHIRAGLDRMRERQLSARLLPELVAEALPTRGGRRQAASRNEEILARARERATAAEARQQRDERKAIG